MPPMTLTTEQFQRIAKALADPTRVEILRGIFAHNEGVTCAGAMENTCISAATGSHHLRELELAELISVAKEGRFKRLTPRRDVWKAYLAELKLI
jgi:ArsR family transcriptional regulator, arsenate/arsenite/antimonite-responsive transcriptional repressor